MTNTWCLLTHSFFNLKLKQFFCYSVTTVPPFSTLLTPTPSSPPPTVNPPIAHARQSSIHVPLLVPSSSCPLYTPPPPLWSLSVCSLFLSLWFYFVHLAVLFSAIVHPCSFLRWERNIWGNIKLGTKCTFHILPRKKNSLFFSKVKYCFSFCFWNKAYYSTENVKLVYFYVAFSMWEAKGTKLCDWRFF